MSNSVYKVFEKIEFKAKLLAQYWDNFQTEISQHLPESYQSEIQELSNNLEKALNQLIYELQNPTLTLATTGTTSSGKSTLVNLLCGAEIVPVAVSEMSAGAVTIEYSKEKSLIIKETPGALWECGEWRGISDDKIYQRLYQAMISYIENRETQPNLACPQSTITYPFRLLKESQLQLPKATRVRILDLPGLAYVGDQGNANVIKQCREALCIVTYNSAETDSQKVKSLLQEVVQQVKDLGGSPARMLFALNRIDVFRADRSWPESENRFVEKAIRDIKNELTEQLKEYTEDIENLKVVKLSTWPALLSLQIQNQDDIYSADACKKADNHFNGLIEDILEDLPRNTQKWNRHDKNRVAEALWEKSYGEEFQENLREHINKHFPQLVIPQIIERFNIAAGNAIAEWATQTTNAVLNSSEERYQEECEKISQIRSSIERFLQISDTNLREPFERIDTKIKQVIAEQSEDDPVLYLESTILELKNVEPYNLLGDNLLGEKLYPLYGWRRELGQGINQVLEVIAQSLETGKVDLDSTNFKKANLLNVNLLGRNLNRLVNLGYTASVAKEGKIMEARTDLEKNQLKQINEELNELAIHLNIVMEDVLKQISSQELNRMYQAVVELFNCHLSHIEKGANDISPNIAIKFPESQLIKVDSQLTFNFRFEAGFPINQGTWKEEIKIEKKRRDWYTLWLWEETFYETQYETRSSDNAEIPSVNNLLRGWLIQSKKEERKIVNKIATWLLEQIDCLKKNVDKLQNDIIDRYQARLDKANQEITLDYENQRNIWQPMQEKAQNLAEEFCRLEIVLKKES
ncbi:dynamin family protein [Aphanizomenon flos-aquae NRERC-008]|uniref:Dynamin family protein n=1 Tax=Aphanizomenon flos-aquae FACHB-1249 TaxID=2692889 RepID=A0ABR8INC6_APHFL|nr:MULTISPECIES: dynamin family protein [Aphanizomenon]MBD2630814.1 dynamin family protein [Aphanizomenon sp. FACHB-1399]MBD2641730.1 dynamin family protein [Aphanizomenon sp. FACHB-1401]MBD2675670.1 dynamin family protein [Aphanizomenon flos-aquae FACHB-1416]MBD2684810.1 dynamin family protein [Aphanizomenon flos-aquae FACHB-1249]MDS9398905.1 dynamin family protein [Aphanizomenon flos-aquae NRERC-008]